MTVLTSECIKTVNNVLNGTNWSSDDAVLCVEQLADRAALNEAEIAFLIKILTADPPPETAIPSHRFYEVYSPLELTALRVIEQHDTNKVINAITDALERVRSNDRWYGWRFAPSYVQALVKIAERYADRSAVISGAALDFLSALLPIVPGSGETYTKREWEPVAISCCAVLGKSKNPHAVVVLDRVLQHHYYQLPLLEAAVAALAQIGTDAAAKSICGVFPRREGESGSNHKGYPQPRHDSLCGKAMEAIIQIGTRKAFDHLTQQIDEANGRPIDTVWHTDVKAVLKTAMPEAAQRNLIHALLENNLSDTTRAQLMGYLRRDTQTARLLENGLKPAQPGYERGTKVARRIREHVRMAVERGEEPEKQTYIIIKFPPHLDTEKARYYQSLFSRTHLPEPGRALTDRLNRQLVDAGNPPIGTTTDEGTREIPLTYLEVSYPQESWLSSLKRVVLPRTTVGANWVGMAPVVGETLFGDEEILKQGNILLTSLRLILSGSFTPSPSERVTEEKSTDRAVVGVGSLMLNELVDVRFDAPIIDLQFAHTVMESKVRINVAYPGASVLSALAGLTLPGSSGEDRQNAAKMRQYNQSLSAKHEAAEQALHQFFTEIADRNAKHGSTWEEY